MKNQEKDFYNDSFNLKNLDYNKQIKNI